jgi:hypothetical protein
MITKDDLTDSQLFELSIRINSNSYRRDAFTSEADVRYFTTEDYLEELNQLDDPNWESEQTVYCIKL